MKWYENNMYTMCVEEYVEVENHIYKRVVLPFIPSKYTGNQMHGGTTPERDVFHCIDGSICTVDYYHDGTWCNIIIEEEK